MMRVKNKSLVVLAGAALMTVAATGDDFVGDWSVDGWSTAGIAEGETSIVAHEESLRGTYNIDSIGTGVPQDTAQYAVVAGADGHVAFDWHWTGFHAWSASFGGLEVFADGPDGLVVVEHVAYQDTPAFLDFSGTASIEVHAGFEFGIRVTGENFDSSLEFYGRVDMTNFHFIGASVQHGYMGDLASENWTATGMKSGEVSVGLPPDAATSSAKLKYHVQLPPGTPVSYREASYTVPTVADGTVELDWNWTGHHAFFQSFGSLRVEVAGPNGTEVIDLVLYQDVAASFLYSGNVRFAVHAGYSYSVIVAGANNDTAGVIQGCIELSGFDFDAPEIDTCPDDIDGDGEVGFADLLSILANWGACP